MVQYISAIVGGVAGSMPPLEPRANKRKYLRPSGNAKNTSAPYDATSARATRPPRMAVPFTPCENAHRTRRKREDRPVVARPTWEQGSDNTVLMSCLDHALKVFPHGNEVVPHSSGVTPHSACTREREKCFTLFNDVFRFLCGPFVRILRHKSFQNNTRGKLVSVVA